MTFQDKDGTVYIFFYNSSAFNGSTVSFPVNRIVKPNGDEIVFAYNTVVVSSIPDFRLSSIRTNRGYMIKFQSGSFVMNSPEGYKTGANSVVALNLAVESCPPRSNSCNFNNIWPMITGGRMVDASGNVNYPSNYYTAPQDYVDVSDHTTQVLVTRPNFPSTGPILLNAALNRPGGRVTTYTYDYAKFLPVLSGPTIVNCPQAPGQISTGSPGWTALWTFPCPYAPVTSIQDGTSTWTYNLDFTFAPIPASPGNYYVAGVTSTRTDPKGGMRLVTALPSGQVTSVRDELNRVTTIDVQPLFDPNEGRINSITYPKGNRTSFTYDARGNVTSITEVPDPGSPLGNIVTRYTYPTSCENWKICNRPISKTDSRGNVTTYSWDPNSGSVLTETAPPDSEGISAVKRFSYSQLYAWVSNGNGGYQQAGPPIWMLSQMRTCERTATVEGGCVGGASDEVITDYYYGPQSGPNNLSLRGVSVTSAGTTLTTCYGYDRFGRKISETKPGAQVSVCP
ncbi:RHS repeat domain-containing protein [Sphingomonas hengshuiensis]|uniref:RHS repeat domain-containing protein n=1 Tax=Sphingomonas hengshuiensis TaxID=1609977 RepID=UPI00138DF5B0|nr:RHS repeat protein [Sphingomonas hengshuiensis]